MFKQLEENLQSMESEMARLKTAVSHIEKSKDAAIKAVELADKTTSEFREHMTAITSSVDSILKPHKELISVTENLVKIIAVIDFPAKLDHQEKQIKLLKILLFCIGSISLVGIVLNLLIK